MTESPSSDYELLSDPTRPKDQSESSAEMDDDDGTTRANRPRRSVSPPPKPLPRTFKSAPLTLTEAEEAERAEESGSQAGAARPRRPSRRDRETDRDSDDEGEKSKLEATPELDTYDARRKIRMVIGGIAAAALLASIYFIFSSLGGGGASSGQDADLYTVDESRMMPPDLESAPRRPPMQPLAPPSEEAPSPELAALGNTRPDPAADHNASPPAPAPPVTPAVGASPTPVVARQTLPPGFAPNPNSSTDAAGWPLRILGERDGSTMILIPPGIYLIGRNDGSVAEAPAVRVELSAFYIDEHEVTVEQYDRYRTDATGRGERVYPKPEEVAAHAPTPKHPIVLVSSADAAAFAAWAGKTLPSDAQWEAAARGVDGRIHPWGPGPLAATAKKLPKQLEPVGANSADWTPLGVADLGANAWEWTSDWYDPRYHETLAAQPSPNPTGAPSSATSQRTIKGSSKSFETSYREGMRADVRLPYLGFRCVLPIHSPGREVAGTAPSNPSNPTAAPPTAAPPQREADLVPF